ncbi:uncharacterized protein UV8b_00731 [Ustilaginoidea virens]|uniref:Uncharacterized protein n=1 Tax=Ustilaginoidea virens TaxID=1159556 RepID=A0A8E5HJB1_USTVR|nr:uncharacterized protein UV8b_00731 [Ustilaginoidea virens]QUC16490.1 hypothetical protein UV8b_00731 [Ustilaginoidea virens]
MPPIYTSLDAARAARSGTFITAWPSDEPYLPPPPIDLLTREMAVTVTVTVTVARLPGAPSRQNPPPRPPRPPHPPHPPHPTASRRSSTDSLARPHADSLPAILNQPID